MKITRYYSDNCSSRENWVPDMISCHICEGTYSGSVSWLCDYRSGVSAHFVVAKDGRVAQIVDMKKSAWANGTKVKQSAPAYYGKSTLATVRNRKTNANYYTISIEFEGFYMKTGGDLTPQQLEAGVELIRYIRDWVKKTYGRDIPFDRQHIVGHNEIAPVAKPNCPGDKFPWGKLMKELNGLGEATKPTTGEGENEQMVVYETFDDIPSWGQPTIEKLIGKGLIGGTGKNSKGEVIYNISQDLLRTLVILGRTGLFDANLARYKTIADVPKWAVPTVQSWLDDDVLADPNNLGLSEDIIRSLILSTRLNK